MPSAKRDQFESVTTQFEQAWNSEVRPWIADFVSQVESSQREDLLSELVPVDIAFRKKKGEKPRPGDYLQLGPEAVAIAFQELHEEFENFDQSDSSRNLDRTVDAPDPCSLSTSATAASSQPGTQFDDSPTEFIGPYKLLQQIGEGGMGTVWMAEQLEPVRRRVALKVIRSEIGSRKAIARFEAERQAVAMMNHQNIAKILDAGTTPNGNPYFVMELVNGIPLNKYCDNQRLDLRARLELMIPVCRAIQHAHQKGIIHRDLKHSNVLVMQHDGKPVPKVIDFGLAKSFEDEQTLTEKTMFTELGKVVGTLQYMSPEQAELNSADVDTRSDIYSMGVMIFKLITGGTLLNNDVIGTNSFMDVLALIREKEPVRASTRLRALNPNNIEKVAERRSTKPEKLIQQTTGDIDWIVMKALDKDRSRRYQTSNGLALDIERYLRNDEVRATPPSHVYRLKKMYTRNRGLFAASLGFAVLLLLGIIGTSLGLIWALDERDFAKRMSDEARIESQNAMRAERVARLAVSMAESRLHAIKIKSAWSDWQLGNVGTAWKMLNSLSEHETGWESRFLKTEFTSSQDVLYGHAMSVVSIDASSDGKYIATASIDNMIKIWDAKTRQIRLTLFVEDAPSQVRFSPDGTVLACADRSNRVTFFDPATGEQVNRIGPFPEDLTSIAYMGDGKRLVIATSDSDFRGVLRGETKLATVKPMIRVVAANNGQVISEFDGHAKEITAVDCTADGQYIVSSSNDSTIRIWEREGNEYKLKKSLVAHAPHVLQVAVSPTEKKFASCGKDTAIRLWNLETGELITTMAGHDDTIWGVAFSPDGKRLVSGSTDRTAKVWDLQGNELVSCQGHYDELNRVCFSADGTEVFSTSDDKTARAWNALRKPSTVVLKAHKDVVWQADFSPDGKRAVSVSEDGSVSIMDVETGLLVDQKTDVDDAVLSVAHSPISNQFATGGTDELVRIFSSDDGSLIHSFKAHDNYIWDLSFSRDGKLLATASSDHTFRIWRTADWSLLKTVEAHDGELGSVRFSDDGRFIVTAGDDLMVRLWDAKTYALLHSFEGHKHTVWRAIFSPDGDLIASSSYDGEVILWDTARREEVRTIAAHQNQVAGLAFTDDGKRVVSASDDTTIKIWDIDTGIELFVLRDKNNSAVVHVSFSRDGSKLISANQDGWVTIRSARSFESEFRPFLPQDAVEMTIEGILAVADPDASPTDIRRELENANKCSSYFPSFQTFTIQGVAHYRLGDYAKALPPLQEARRLEPIEYGEPDLLPNIEAYLTLTLLKLGRFDEANQFKAKFMEKINHKSWANNKDVLRLQADIDAEFKKAAQSRLR